MSSDPTPATGILPYLQRIWPDLQGQTLVKQAAESLNVHYTTVYKWAREGMASAPSKHVLDLSRLYEARTGAWPSLESLQHPSIR